jgi:hypothetical protein
LVLLSARGDLSLVVMMDDGDDTVDAQAFLFTYERRSLSGQAAASSRQRQRVREREAGGLETDVLY